MAYTFKYLSADEQAKVKADATKKPVGPAPNESMLRAWEADLAAHQALAASKTGEDRKPHDDAIATLEAALNKAPRP